MLLVEHPNETGPPALWRGIAAALFVRRREHCKGRLADELLDHSVHRRSNLLAHDLDRVPILLLRSVHLGLLRARQLSVER